MKGSAPLPMSPQTVFVRGGMLSRRSGCFVLRDGISMRLRMHYSERNLGSSSERTRGFDRIESARAFNHDSRQTKAASVVRAPANLQAVAVLIDNEFAQAALVGFVGHHGAGGNPVGIVVRGAYLV